MSQVTAIVVAFNSAEALPDCLSALRRAGAQLLVVDNASQDQSCAIAKAHGARVISNIHNEGYGRANNLGVKAAEGDFVLIANPDVVLEEGALTSLLDAASRYPEFGIIAPKIVEPSGRIFFHARSLLALDAGISQKLPASETRVSFVSGACFLMRREVYLELGGFDPNIFLFYEDDDLCRRVIDSGRAIIYAPQASARHARGRSSAKRAGQIFTTRWHQAWSKAYVSRKYALPNPALSTLLINALKVPLALLSFRPSLIERYAGSAAGALAFLAGRSALSRQQLQEAQDKL